MPLDLNLVRLLDRALDIMERISRNGLHIHLHQPGEKDPREYKVHTYVPPDPTTGEKPQ